jgi:hypothetical protein
MDALTLMEFTIDRCRVLDYRRHCLSSHALPPLDATYFLAAHLYPAEQRLYLRTLLVWLLRVATGDAAAVGGEPCVRVVTCDGTALSRLAGESARDPNEAVHVALTLLSSLCVAATAPDVQVVTSALSQLAAATAALTARPTTLLKGYGIVVCRLLVSRCDLQCSVPLLLLCF